MQLTTDQLRAYEAQTARLDALARFVSSFAPAHGERSEGGYGAELDRDAPPGVLDARDDAVEAAFGAARRIAANS